MDNTQFPQEDDFLLKDAAPVQPDLPEEPEITELSFSPEPESVPEEVPAEPVPLSPEELEEPPVLPAESPEEQTALPPADEAVSEPEAIPPFQSDSLEAPDLGTPLTPDEDALNFHGILRHGEQEPPFDLSVLDDPELNAPEEAPVQPEAPEDLTILPDAERTEPEEGPADQEYRDGGQDFEEIMEAPAPQPEVPPHSRPARKGRPKRKKGEGLLGIPNILTTIVWLALILAIGVTAGRMLWVCAADVLAFGRENKPVTVTIYEADDMDSITDKLYDAGLIRYKSLFHLYASISDAEEKIQPGIYDLNTLYDYHALVNFMTPRSSREVIELTIPEGYTCRQIFDLLEENRVCTAVDAASYAANGELKDYWFLEGVTRGDKYCLEGYLFPDTYEFYKNSTPREALERMLNNFEKRFSEEMRAQIDTLNETVTGGGYTVREVTIVASLIERESAAPSESPAIAGVIYNRLFNWDGNPAYLNIDAAIVYAQGGNAETIDTSLDSPYNTYTHTGLTPTPISNPGLASLQAALSPESHNYYYYVLNPSTGMHAFATTQEEHNANIAAFYG